ncbi:MAG: hypothetical protein EBR09_02945 [Proteobacteria bacterium]|nr:hypothetical protein [Pseudomonadota bacterium]
MKRLIGTFIVFVLAGASLYPAFREKTEFGTAEAPTPEQKNLSVSGSSSKLDSPSTGQTQTKSEIHLTAFDKDPSQLREVIGAFEDDLNPERAKTNFSQSGIDNQENYRAAHTVLRTHYNEKVTHREAELRVLALHFLSATQFFNIEDCLKTLESQIGAYSRANGQNRNALIWDIYGISQLCARHDPESVDSIAENAKPDEIRSQIRLAVSKMKTSDSNPNSNSFHL